MTTHQMYERMIQSYLGQVLAGKPFPQDERKLTPKEVAGTGLRYQTTPLHDLRQRELLTSLYTRLEALPTDVREKVAMTVADPILDGAFQWLGARGGTPTLEEFVKNYDGKTFVERRRLPTYLRSLVLLDILRQRPELASKLEEDSGYFPHRLLALRKATGRELAQELAQVIPTLYSDELSDALARNTQLVTNDPSVASAKGSFTYAIPAKAPLRFAAGTTQEALDSVFTPEIKRDVYRTLDEYLVITAQAARDGNRSPRTLPRPYGLTRMECAIALQAMEDYAVNLLLGQFKDGQPLHQPFRSVRARYRIEGDDLVVERYRGTQRLTKDSRFQNTAMRLPYLAHLLERAYSASAEERTQ